MGVGTNYITQTPTSDNKHIQPDELAGYIAWDKKNIKTTTRITDSDSPYTALATDVVIFADTDDGAITVNLPAGIDGKVYTIKNVGTSGNDVTLAPNGSEKIFGTAASFTIIDSEIFDINYDSTEGWF